MKPYLTPFLSSSISTAYAYGDLDSPILSAIEALLEDPQNDTLYSSRCTWYLHYQEYMKSIQDFEIVESLASPFCAVKYAQYLLYSHFATQKK